MAKLLRKQFEEKGVDPREVVSFAGMHGEMAACGEYGTGYLSMRRFLTDETGDENFGAGSKLKQINPPLNKTVIEEVCDRLEAWVKNRVISLEAEIALKDEMIKQKDAELARYKGREVGKLEKGLAPVIEMLG